VTAIRYLFDHHALRLRRTWWSALISGIGAPTFFLLAIGVGLGSQISETDQASLGSGTYIAFLGPGLLATTAMLISSTEGMWPTLALLRWGGMYRALLTTPISARQLGTGHALWIGVRALIAASCYLIVLAVFGALASWLAVAIPLVATLIGLAHGAPIVGISANLESTGLYAVLLRVVLFPMFIFSGAFFPVDDLPVFAAWFVRALPIWHGVELCRHLALGNLSNIDAIHLLYLVIWSAAGIGFARYRFHKHVAP